MCVTRSMTCTLIVLTCTRSWAPWLGVLGYVCRINVTSCLLRIITARMDHSSIETYFKSIGWIGGCLVFYLLCTIATFCRQIESCLLLWREITTYWLETIFFFLSHRSILRSFVISWRSWRWIVNKPWITSDWSSNMIITVLRTLDVTSQIYS